MIDVLQLRKSVRLALPSGVWPSLLVLAVAVVLLGGIFSLGYLALREQTTGSSFLPLLRVPWFPESVIYYHMEYALNSDEYNDVIFLGGSGVLAGLKTREFENQTGLRAYNFGNGIDIGPDGHLEMFRAYLHNHPEPKMLVYVAFARDIGDPSSTDQELKNRFLRVYGTVHQPDETRPSYSFREYYQEGFWGIYGFVRGGFKHPLDAPRGARPSHRGLEAPLSEERGWQPYPQARTLDLRYLEQLEAFTVSDWYDASFREMAQLAREQDIPLVIYLLPVPDHNNEVDDGPVIAWSQQFKADYPEVEFRGLPFESYELQFWGNPFHLNQRGAETFTSKVSAEIAALLNAETAR